MNRFKSHSRVYCFCTVLKVSLLYLTHLPMTVDLTSAMAVPGIPHVCHPWDVSLLEWWRGPAECGHGGGCEQMSEQMFHTYSLSSKISMSGIQREREPSVLIESWMAILGSMNYSTCWNIVFTFVLHDNESEQSGFQWHGSKLCHLIIAYKP